MDASLVWYEIRVQGHLSVQAIRHVEGWTAQPLHGRETILVGPLRDQAALYGVLHRLEQLGVTLLSVGPVKSR